MDNNMIHKGISHIYIYTTCKYDILSWNDHRLKVTVTKIAR